MTKRTEIDEVDRGQAAPKPKKAKITEKKNKDKTPKLKAPKPAKIPKAMPVPMPRENLADLSPAEFRARALESMWPAGHPTALAPMTLDEYLGRGSA